jgi:elongation factor P
MASTADLRNGYTLRHNNDLWTVVEFQHVKPGKGPAFVRAKLKSLTSGKVVDNTWPSGHKVEEIRVERRNSQFLYKDELGYNFMNNDTYEQVVIVEKLIDAPQFLTEGQEVTILVLAENDQPLACELPQSVVLEVTYTEPGLKGDTATNTLKLATVSSGAEVRIPLFIGQGEKIKIDTATGAYVERAKV